MGLPMLLAKGQQYNFGIKPTVILYTYIINRPAGTPKQTQKHTTMSLGTHPVTQLCHIGFGVWLEIIIGELESIVKHTIITVAQVSLLYQC